MMRTPPANTQNKSAAADGAAATGNAAPGALPEGRRKRTQVRLMFDRIAPRYDLLNRLLTLGLDRRWRRGALDAAAVGPGDTVLDLACGTGDLSEAALARGARVLGVDFSGEMLRFACRRGIGAAFVQADALRLPLAAGGIDVLLCGFALRNFVSLEGALAEAARVLCPGGRMALLDVDRPRRRPLSTLHSLYFDHVVPLVGAWLSDRAAYRYLPASTSYLPGPDAFRALLEAQGFCDVERRGFLFDSAQLWVARRAAMRNPQQPSNTAPPHEPSHNPAQSSNTAPPHDPAPAANADPSHHATPASNTAPSHNPAPGSASPHKAPLSDASGAPPHEPSHNPAQSSNIAPPHNPSHNSAPAANADPSHHATPALNTAPLHNPSHNSAPAANADPSHHATPALNTAPPHNPAPGSASPHKAPPSDASGVTSHNSAPAANADPSHNPPQALHERARARHLHGEGET